MSISPVIPSDCASPASRPNAWSWKGLFASLTRTRGRRVVCILVGLWLVNAFDLFMTQLAHQHNLLQESNPIAARVLPLGPWMLFLYKSSLVVAGTVGLYVIRRRFIAEFASASLLLIYVFVAVRWKICFEIYDLTCNEVSLCADQQPGWISLLPL